MELEGGLLIVYKCLTLLPAILIISASVGLKMILSFTLFNNWVRLLELDFFSPFPF